MKTLTALFCSALLAGGAHAAPFAKGDSARPARSCTTRPASVATPACSAATAARCTRAPTIKPKPRSSWPRRISGCNANTGAGWFPEDEAHVAAYLNQQYYKFK